MKQDVRGMLESMDRLHAFSAGKVGNGRWVQAFKEKGTN